MKPVHCLAAKSPEGRRKPWLASDRTICGVDAYRRGVLIKGVNVLIGEVSCKRCLRGAPE